MARVIIRFSLPEYNSGELLDGTASNEIVGYRNVSLTVQSNIFKADIPLAMRVSRLVPTGFFMENAPQLQQAPPNTGVYQITSTGVNYSKLPMFEVVSRPDGEVSVG